MTVMRTLDRMSRMTVMLINRPDKIFTRRDVNIAGIDCTVVRKNTRRLHIYIKPPDGEVLVTAPFLYTEREIKSFVSSKADWIRKHQKRIREKSSQASMALEYVDGETLYFWGEPYELTVIEEAGRKRGRITLDPEPVFDVREDELARFGEPGAAEACLRSKAHGAGVYSGASTMPGDRAAAYKEPGLAKGSAVLVMPPGSTKEQREQLIKKKYKELLENEAGRVLAFWSEQTGLQYSEWHSRYMKSRWGSLSVRNKRVCLNTRLAEKPEICLIYVALHEVAHVKEPNHGPRFKAILDKYMPDWREAERMLKG